MHKFLVIIILLTAAFLRLYALDSLPPSLYWEEVAIGYDAFAIAQTGKDHHGTSFPLVAFESFGDWKPSLYFYSVVPLVSLFGLNAWAVRLPAALSGIMIVLGNGLLAKYFFQAFSKKAKTNPAENLQLIAMTLTAISPWAIIFSRAAWEVNLATAMVLWGVICFVKMIQVSNTRFVYGLSFCSVSLLIGSMYTYHAARIVAPFLGLGLICLWFFAQKLKLGQFITEKSKQFLLMGVVGGILVLPLVLSLGSTATTQRFAETSIFSDITIIEQSNLLKEKADNALWARLVYHRYLLFGQEILSNFSSHFSFDYLFINGDQNPRHSIQYMGQLYHIEALFLIIGFYLLIKRRNRYGFFLIFWLFIAIFPASITKASPHALRTLLALPVFLLLISHGLYSFYTWGRWLLEKFSIPFGWQMVGVAILLAYLIEFLMFGRFYSRIYPQIYDDQWQYGYQQMIPSFNQIRQQYPDHSLFITREYGRPAMYFWFFSQTDPRQVQAQQTIASKDQSEYLTFEEVSFINQANEVAAFPALVASSPMGRQSLVDQGRKTELLDQVTDLSGEPIWNLYLVE